MRAPARVERWRPDAALVRRVLAPARVERWLYSTAEIRLWQSRAEMDSTREWWPRGGFIPVMLWGHMGGAFGPDRCTKFLAVVDGNPIWGYPKHGIWYRYGWGRQRGGLSSLHDFLNPKRPPADEGDLSSWRDFLDTKRPPTDEI
ncbi:MAG: hypothetical protein ACREKE_01515 [bacterium]